LDLVADAHVNAFARRLLAVLLCCALIGGAAAASNTPPVDDARLRNAQTDDGWLMYRRTYDAQAFAPFDQINAGNVAQLRQLFSYPTGLPQGHEVTPRTQKVTFARDGLSISGRARLEAGRCRSGLRAGGGRGSLSAGSGRGSLGAIWRSAGNRNRVPDDDGVVDHQHFFDD